MKQPGPTFFWGSVFDDEVVKFFCSRQKPDAHFLLEVCLCHDLENKLKAVYCLRKYYINKTATCLAENFLLFSMTFQLFFVGAKVILLFSREKE